MDASLPGGRTTASIRHLHGPCTGHCRPRSRSRIMDDESVELPGHHHCLCAQPFFGSAGDSLRTNHWNTSPQRSAGGSGTPHHCAGNASLLPACFRGCSPTFARTVSPVSENEPSRQFVNRGNPTLAGTSTGARPLRTSLSCFL